MTEWQPDICIYHDPCDDGFAAAWCVRKKWGDTVDFRPTNYGLAVPDESIDGKRILIADFSFSDATMLAMAERADSIVVLDHHKTAQADLELLGCGASGLTAANIEYQMKIGEATYPRILTEFDMERSGAVMTWNFCFPNSLVPEFIRYIEDRDLWKFQMMDTKAFTAWLRSYPREFEQWDSLARDFLISETCLQEGKAILRARMILVNAITDTAMPRKVGEFEAVPVAAAPYDLVSEVAHELLQRNPDAPFAACVVDAHGGRTWSLRSDDDREDVSAIAKSFGGGGHRNAAGFRVPV